MYQIILGLDDKWHCWCTIQDGTERWVKDDLEEAVKSMKTVAEVLNHAKIRRRDIEFLKEQRKVVEETELVPYKIK